MIPESKTNLAILISNKGTGTNLQALIDASQEGKIPCQVSLVVSDKPNAQGLERAIREGIPTELMVLRGYRDQVAREEYGAKLAEFLNERGVQISILGGFATVLSLSYFTLFKGPTLNVHPGLLPYLDGTPFLFPDGTVAPWNRGLITDQAVATFLKLKYAGSTIHLATPEADWGPILKRVVVEVKPEDTLESLYHQRLKPAEHRGFIEVLKEPQNLRSHLEGVSSNMSKGS